MQPKTLKNQSISASNAAKALECDYDTLLGHLRAGRLPGVKFGKSWRIPSYAIEALLAGRDPKA